MEQKEQIALWRQGKSLHDHENNCCCPDFSCCNPRLLAPEAVREAYIKAYQEGDNLLIHNIQIQFLQAACNDIAESDPEIGSIHVSDLTQYNRVN